MATSDLPSVEVIDGRLRFVIPLGFVDAQPRPCDCDICNRRPGARPGWLMWEPEVECVWAGGRRERKRSGDAGRPAA